MSSVRFPLLPICFLLLTITWTAAPGRAVSKTAVRRSIEAAYRAGDAAFARKDAAKVVSLWAPNYRLVTKTGKTVPRAEVGRRLRAWISTSQTLNVKTRVQSFFYGGAKATVTMIETFQATARHPKTKKLMRYRSETRAREVWAQHKGKWLKEQSTSLSIRQYVDGKPVKTQ